MKPTPRIADVVASAFLDGSWTPEPMATRASLALGMKFSWLRRVARAALRKFPEPPFDRFEVLAAFLAEDEDVVHARRLPLYVTFGTPFVGMREAHPRWGLPRIDTVGDLAKALDLDVPTLLWLADMRGLSRLGRTPHYHPKWMAKPRGGFRLLEAPKSRLKAVQRTLLTHVIDKIPPHPSAHGFVRGKGVLSHASIHVGRDVVLRMDLEDFFASVPVARVFATFRALGYTANVARMLGGLVTTRAAADEAGLLPAYPTAHDIDALRRTRLRMRGRHLPQGAPTSPALANLCAFGLDVRLAAAAAKVGARYSRYADDLVFSGDREFASNVRGFSTLVAAIAIDEGFVVNHRKTHVARAGRQQKVTGIVVNRMPSIARPEVDLLEATLVNCVRTGPEAQNRDHHPDFERHLRGRVAWMVHVKPALARKLVPLLAAIRWSEA